MNSFFPALYPDELLYSAISRYYDRSGYCCYTFAAEDIFHNKREHPNVLFINGLTEAAVSAITAHKSMERLILENTMFGCYGRFLPRERRNRSFSAMCQMQPGYMNLLYIPTRKTKEDKFLRYCPLCVQSDRKTYGETYWHRTHQLPGLRICPLHYCGLVLSTVRTDRSSSLGLFTAEEVVWEKSRMATEDMPINTSPLQDRAERELAVYISKVFQSDMNELMQNDKWGGDSIGIGKLLHSYLIGTPYVSARGEMRNLRVLAHDFNHYYTSISGNTLQEEWQLKKIFCNKNLDFYDICLTAHFLQIPPDDLAMMRPGELMQKEKITEEIQRLRAQGLKYPEIARRIGLSYDYTKVIASGKKDGNIRKVPVSKKNGRSAKDWARIDHELLPKATETARRIWTGVDRDGRPGHVTIEKLKKALGMRNGFDKCPACATAIQPYLESQEEYWRREVAWAIGKIEEQGMDISLTRIMALTNLRKSNLERCYHGGERDLLTRIKDTFPRNINKI